MFCSVIFSLLMSGIIFGYSGLYMALVFNVKAFASLCEEDEPLPCQAQHDRLTLMYTLGASTISGCAFIVGVVLDIIGPRVTVCAGSLISLSGLLALAYANTISEFLYYYGFIALAIGGPCIANSVTNFGELFGRNSAVIISAQTGGFNSSSLVMFILGQLVTNWGYSFRSVMLAYTVVPVAVFFTSLFLFCDKPFISEEAGSDEGEMHRVWSIRQKMKQKLMKGARGVSVTGEGAMGLPSPDNLMAPLLNSEEQETEEPPLRLYNVSFTQQISSPVFWSMFIVTGFFVLRVNFYISTISSQLLYEALRTQDPPFSNLFIAREDAQHYVALFNIVLPIVGIFMVPIVGYVLVQMGLGPSFLLIALTNTIFSIVNVLNFIPLPFQTICFFAFAASRPFIFGAMAAYIGRLFGFKNFGKLYGLARFSGAIATAMTYPLAYIGEVMLEGNYFYVNLGFLLFEVLCFAFPIYLVYGVFSGFIFRPGYLYKVDPDLEEVPGNIFIAGESSEPDSNEQKSLLY